MVAQMPIKKLPLLSLVYFAIVVCFCLSFVFGAFILTVEPDEVWNLMSTMKALGIPLPPTSAVDKPITTTGGLHFVLHGLIALWRSGDILAHRLASIGVTLVLLIVVFKLIERHVKDRVLAAAGTALFVTAPGFLLQASLATSEIIATTIFLLASLFWVRSGTQSLSMALLGGTLFGLACATRMTCLSMLPAILVWSAIAHRGWIARFVYPLMAITAAVLVFAGCVGMYVYAFGDTPWSKFLVATGLSSGIGVPFPGVMLRLNYLTVANGIIPTAAIVALAGWFASRLELQKESDQDITRLCGFLLLAGSAGWLSWVLKAPISHIRYLWPAIPLMWLTAVLLGVSALGRVLRMKTAMIGHLTIILICATQGLLNVRMLAVGDSLELVYETARQSSLGIPQNIFTARKDQEAMASLVAALPPSATIHALMEPAAYPITYLSSRTVRSFRQPMQTAGENYLLVLPTDYSVWLPNWDVIGWLQVNTTLVERRGKYALYRVHGSSQPPSQ